MSDIKVRIEIEVDGALVGNNPSYSRWEEHRSCFDNPRFYAEEVRKVVNKAFARVTTQLDEMEGK